MPSLTAHDSTANGVNSRRLLAARSEVVVLPGDFANQRQLWAAVWARRRSVIRIALVFSGLVFLYTLIGGVGFLSTGQLYLGEISMMPSPTQTPSGGFGLNETVQGLVASEMEILQSVSLVRRAVLESGVNVTISAVDTGLMPYGYFPYIKWLLTGKDPDIVDAVLDVVRPTNTELARNTRSPREFIVRFLTPTDYEVTERETGTSLGRGALASPFNGQGLNMTLQAGPRGPPAAGARYDVLVRPLDRVIDSVSKKLKVTVPKQTSAGSDVNVVTLEYPNASPQLAARFLDRLMSAYLDARQSWKTEDASAAETFVTSQLGGVRDSLDQLQAKLAEYRRGNPAVVLDDETKAMVEQVGKYEELRATTRLEVAALSEMKRTLEGANPPMGAFLVGETNDPVLASMAESLTQAREKLADVVARYNDTAPDVRDQRARVADQLEAIRSYVVSRSRRAQANLRELDAIIDQFNTNLKTVPAAKVGLAQLTRESEVYSKTYSYLLERQQEAAIFKASTLSKNRVLYAPEAPLRVDSPNVLIRAASLIVGLALGAVIIVARALFGASFDSILDVRRSLIGVPILATIPPAGTRRALRPRGGATPAAFDVTALPAASAFGEAFRTLRATLLGWRSTVGCGLVVLVTSPRAGDGKTTFVLSLASALSASGRGVLVIDSDFRREFSDSTERVTGSGLRGVLRGTSDWRANLERIGLAQGSFHALRAGGVDVPELLTTSKFAELIDDVRHSFDFILIDSSSYPAVSDALVLSQLADVTFSLVRIQQTPRTLTAEHLNELAAHTTDLAVVINDAVGTVAGRPSDRPKDDNPKRVGRRAAKDPWPRATRADPLVFNGERIAIVPARTNES